MCSENSHIAPCTYDIPVPLVNPPVVLSGYSKTCYPKSTIETQEKGVSMFKVINKKPRMTSMTSFSCFIGFEQVSVSR